MLFDKNFLNKKILIVSDNDEGCDEEDRENERLYISKISDQAKNYGVEVFYEEVLNAEELREALSKYNKNDVIVFNWCERFNNTDGTEAEVTRIYEDLGFIFTGGSTKTMELTANKFLCIQKLQSKGIKVPESYLVKKNELDRFEIDFSKKYIIKSNKLHASSGISLLNLVDNKQDFLTVAKGLTELTKDDILVQKFIEGEEYTAVIWGSNKNPEVLPILKLNFANKKLPNIYTENAKFIDGQEYANRTYEILDKSESIYSKIEESVISTYKAFEMEDYARLDVRVNNNEVYVIDYNSNPYINSLYEGDEDCEVYICAKILGYNFGETILKICEYAYMRTKNN